MIEFEVDMARLLEEGELDRVVLNDENGDYPSMQFEPSRGICHDVYPKAAYCFTCSECGHIRLFVQGWDSVTDSSQDEFNYCPNCGAKVVQQ